MGFTLTKSYAVHMDACREELGHVLLKGFRPLGDGKGTAACSPAADMARTPCFFCVKECSREVQKTYKKNPRF